MWRIQALLFYWHLSHTCLKFWIKQSLGCPFLTPPIILISCILVWRKEFLYICNMYGHSFQSFHATSDEAFWLLIIRANLCKKYLGACLCLSAIVQFLFMQTNTFPYFLFVMCRHMYVLHFLFLCFSLEMAVCSHLQKWMLWLSE